MSTNSLLFDGVDEFVQIGDVAALQFERTNSFSISAWVQRPSGGTHTIVAKEDTSAGGYRGYNVYVDTSNRIVFELISSFSTNLAQVRTRLGYVTNSTWRQVVVTYDGSSTAAGLKIYVDGVERPTDTIYDTLSATILSTANFRIARRDDASALFWNGYIDEVAVYDKQLSAAEVLSLHTSLRLPVDHASVGPTANLVGYWRMGEGATFPTIPDDSTNANDGTMTNMEVGDITATVTTGVTAQDIGVFEEVLGIVVVPSEAFQVREVINFLETGGSGGGTSYFRMRGLADPGPGYVSWTVTGSPDFLGAFAPSAVQGSSVVTVVSWVE